MSSISSIWAASLLSAVRTGRISRLLLLAALVGATTPASAAKWSSCPTPPFPVYPSAIGATSSPFIHPGHDLTIVLNEEEVAESGGFSLDADGNEVQVRFLSPFGPAVEPSAFFAGATGASSLTFEFPSVARGGMDGEPVVGPVEVRVFADDRLVADVLDTDLVAVPPTNDLSDILLGDETDRDVLAALDASGDLWVPVRFSGERMEMPTCPGDFIFPVDVQVAAAVIAGDTESKLTPLRNVRRVSAYFGDVRVRDYTLYGWLFPERIRLIHVANTLGVSICQLNDALELVIRVKGDRSWSTSRGSPFRSFSELCGPVPLRLQAVRTKPSPERKQSTHLDSFDNECSPSPEGRSR